MRKLALSLGMLALFACGSSEAPASSSSEGETPVPADEPQGPGATGETGETDETGATGETGATTEPTPPAVEAPPPVVAADACARARSCCPAYAAALPSSGAADRAGGNPACASLELAIAAGGPAADEACQGALEGFRRSLEATGRDVPTECR